MEPKVLFEDVDILVIDKPAGMTVNRADTTKHEVTVQDRIEEYLKIRSTKHEIRNKSETLNTNDQNGFEFRNSDFEFTRRAGIVHRLDKETSGILLIAKNPESFENLQRQFKDRTVKKKYTALVHGEVRPDEGEINVPVGRLPWNRERFGVIPGGRESVTKYKVISSFPVIPTESRIAGRVEGSYSHNVDVRDSSTSLGMTRKKHFTLLELAPLTGRTHQIRVHLKYLGFPIVADPLYGGRKQAKSDREWCSRLFLHASEIAFRHPRTGEGFTIESKLPDDLQSVVERLR